MALEQNLIDSLGGKFFGCKIQYASVARNFFRPTEGDAAAALLDGVKLQEKKAFQGTLLSAIPSIGNADNA